MHFIASHHHRRSARCPRTNVEHALAGTIEDSTWVMLDEHGAQLADAAASEDPEMYSLLRELRAAIPIATIHVAVVRREDFPSPTGVCNFHATNPQKHCGESPAPRPMEISTVVPGSDCQRPKARCPRCTEKFHSAISAVLHRHYDTQAPAPILPPAPRELTPADVAVAKRLQVICDIERVLIAVGSRSRALSPRAGAELLASAIETLTTTQKETANVEA